MTKSKFNLKRTCRSAAVSCLGIFFCFCATSSRAQETYLGDIRMFAGNFAPRGWALCNGQILLISQNQALFALLGTQYGGDGRTNFALPNLQDRFAYGSATNYDLGEVGGQNSFNIFITNLPFHQHTLNVYKGPGDTDNPNNASLAVGQTPDLTTVSMPYSTNPPNATLSPQSAGIVGSSTPVAINPPYIGINYIIALAGIFPSRN